MTTPPRPTSERSAKITPSHVQRLACIYVRQSSLKQVERNRESQRNQYQLAERAAALGWSPEQIRVIDCDLGLSGQDAASRQGFQEVVTAVSLGQVGILFGYEVSRLARNNSDWYHLLDLAAMFGTLIADVDGIYDPRHYNDRLLLGLKGTMSEAELHLIRQRMTAGRLAQVHRGVYRQTLPTGLLRQPDGMVVMEPDVQVRQTIALVFTQFAALGSCRQVLRFLRQADIRLPRRQVNGLDKGQILWLRPAIGAIYAMIQNPAYAGAFVYGRRPVDPTARRRGRSSPSLRRRPMSEWTTIHQDVYPAYISWEQYLANQARLQQNAARFDQRATSGRGAARTGAALLQGVVVCGACGCQMRVSYKGPHRYQCMALLHEYDAAMCASVQGPAVDAIVVQAFFDALAPAHLNALDAVLADQHRERVQLDHHWQLRLKRATYEAQLAQRQYQAVDPENRLVAAELERRWEEHLRALTTTQADYERFQQAVVPAGLSAQQRHQLEQIAESLPALWHEGQISIVQQKELLRSLIRRVILQRPRPDRIAVTLVWVSGAVSTLTAAPPLQRATDLPNYAALLARVQALCAAGQDDAAIAHQLRAEGYRSARQQTITAHAVKTLRLRQGWQRPGYTRQPAFEMGGDLTPAGVAARLGVTRPVVYHWITSGRIAAAYLSRHPHSNAYLIRDDPTLMAALRQYLDAKC